MTFHGLDCLGADPSLDEVATGAVVLSRGSKGPAVSYVQEHLAFTGANVDGDFGAKTEARVKEFQIAKGLSADGKVGKDTMAAIDAMVMAGQRFSPAPVSAPAAPRSSVSVSVPSSVKVPTASAIATQIETAKSTPVTTYAAYVLVALAVGGAGYAVLRR